MSDDKKQEDVLEPKVGPWAGCPGGGVVRFFKDSQSIAAWVGKTRWVAFASLSGSVSGADDCKTQAEGCIEADKFLRWHGLLPKMEFLQAEPQERSDEEKQESVGPWHFDSTGDLVRNFKDGVCAAWAQEHASRVWAKQHGVKAVYLPARSLSEAKKLADDHLRSCGIVINDRPMLDGSDLIEKLSEAVHQVVRQRDEYKSNYLKKVAVIDSIREGLELAKEATDDVVVAAARMTKADQRAAHAELAKLESSYSSRLEHEFELEELKKQHAKEVKMLQEQYEQQCKIANEWKNEAYTLREFWRSRANEVKAQRDTLAKELSKLNGGAPLTVIAPKPMVSDSEVDEIALKMFIAENTNGTEVTCATEEYDEYLRDTCEWSYKAARAFVEYRDSQRYDDAGDSEKKG